MPGVGKQTLYFPGKRGSFWLRKQGWSWIRLSSEHLACKSPSLLYTFKIRIIALTICFLISLFFPLNCSPLKDPCFLFLQFSTPSHCSRRGKEKMGEATVSSSVVLENLSGGFDLGSTIPKPCQAFFPSSSLSHILPFPSCILVNYKYLS